MRDISQVAELRQATFYILYVTIWLGVASELVDGETGCNAALLLLKFIAT